MAIFSWVWGKPMESIGNFGTLTSITKKPMTMASILLKSAGRAF